MHPHRSFVQLASPAGRWFAGMAVDWHDHRSSAVAIAGPDNWNKVNVEKDASVAAGPAYAKVFEAAANARELAADIAVTDWNLATAAVITGKAAGQIMVTGHRASSLLPSRPLARIPCARPGWNPVRRLVVTLYFPKNKDADVPQPSLSWLR